MMRYPLTMALLLAVTLLGAAGTARAQADQPPNKEEADAEPSLEMILKSVSAYADKIRLTRADVKQFIELARDFDEIGRDTELAREMSKAVRTGQPFEDIVLASPEFKEWSEKQGVDGAHWLKVFFRVQILVTRGEIAEQAGEREQAILKELAELEEGREDMDPELYAERKEQIEAEREEFRKETELWKKAAPEPDEEEGALLLEYRREIDIARGRGGYEDEVGVAEAEADPEPPVAPDPEAGEEEADDEIDEGDAPEEEGMDEGMDDEPFESGEDTIEQFGRVIASVTAYVKDTRITEADLKQYVALAASFDQVGEDDELDQKVQEAMREGKPFADLILGSEKYKAWTAKNGVAGDRWLGVFLRIQMIMGRKEAIESQAENEEFSEMQRKELEQHREEMGEEAYREELKWIEDERAESLKYLEIWKGAPTATLEEAKLLEKYDEAMKKALGWEEEEDDLDVPDDADTPDDAD